MLSKIVTLMIEKLGFSVHGFSNPLTFRTKLGQEDRRGNFSSIPFSFFFFFFGWGGFQKSNPFDKRDLGSPAHPLESEIFSSLETTLRLKRCDVFDKIRDGAFLRIIPSSNQIREDDEE